MHYMNDLFILDLEHWLCFDWAYSARLRTFSCSSYILYRHPDYTKLFLKMCSDFYIKLKSRIYIFLSLFCVCETFTPPPQKKKPSHTVTVHRHTLTDSLYSFSYAVLKLIFWSTTVKVKEKLHMERLIRPGLPPARVDIRGDN